MTDDKLDRLMRDIEIPADLKNSLFKIPGESNSSEPTLASAQRSNGLSFRAAGIVAFAFAASIIGLAAFVVYQSRDNGETIVVDNSPESGADKELPRDLLSVSAAMLLEQMKSNSFEIEFLVMENNVAQFVSGFQSKLASASAELSEMDQSSVALCGAIQAGTDFGNNIETVRAELLQVKVEFPGTLGAKLAEQFIQKSKHESNF